MMHIKTSTLSKVPEITIMFWIIKIVATTLGETGGDFISMSMNLGYLIGSLIFTVIFTVAVLTQVKSTNFNSLLYWTTIVATTTLGTTLADFMDRSLGIGYTGGALILLLLLFSSLTIWYLALGSIAINTVCTPKEEIFYWTTIMFSQTLGTALGDWMTDTSGFGYTGSAVVFSSLIIILALIYCLTNASRTILFWATFVLTRPLGAVLGDFLDKPLSAGGLELNRALASIVLLVFIIGCILIFPQKAATKPH